MYTETAGPRIRLTRRLQSLGLMLGRIESTIADLARVQGEIRDALAACEAGACGVLAD
jgi:hypothetical protein